MTVLAGRAEQLAVLDGAIDDALLGAGRLVLISGEGGIGKSQLVEAAAERATRRGMSVNRGYAIDDVGAPPLWPWLRAGRTLPDLCRILDHSNPADTDPTSRFRMFADVVDTLRGLADAHPIVLVLEDLHWADRSSVLLLRHLSSELIDSKLLVLTTFRERKHSPLAAILPDLMRGEAYRTIRLTGLDAAAIACWLRTIPELAEWADHAALLESRTGGNPLFVRLLAEALPATGEIGRLDRVLAERSDLRSLVTRRLDGLSNGARDLIAAASVLAERIHPEFLGVLTGGAADQVGLRLSEAVGAGVLRDGPAGLSFAHALVRDAVYAELPPSTRSALHERVATVLTRQDQEAFAGLIATHWHQAGRSQECLEWARKAASQALSTLAYDEAAAFAQLAVDCASQSNLGALELAEVVLESATALFAASQISASLQACVRAADLADDADRPDLMAAAALVVHGIGSLDVYRVIRGLGDRALRRLPPGDTELRARLLAQLAMASAEDEGGQAAQQLSAQALRVAEASGDSQAILEAIAARHLSIAVPDTVHERMELALRAIDLGARSRTPMAELWGHLWKLEASLQLGDLVDVDREMAVINQIADARRSPVARWHHERLLATRALMAGDFSAALHHNEAAKALADRMDDISTNGMYYAFLQQVAVVRGDPNFLPPSMVEALRSAPPIPLVRISIPTMLALRGDRSAAVAAFEEFRELPATFPVGTRWAATLTLIGTVAVLLDDAEVAEVVYRLLRPTAHYCTGDGSGAVVFFGSNALGVADLALTAGHHDEALRLYADAVTVNMRLGARPFVALSRLGWAKALVAKPDPDPGTADLTLPAKLAAAAAAEFCRLGMPGPLAAATELSQRIGIARRSVDPLSSRESEVAEMVAQSLSNKAIAARLFLSERTVESHVRSILAKLGFAGRTEIVAWVIQSGQAVDT